jgi:hypothetical protein
MAENALLVYQHIVDQITAIEPADLPGGDADRFVHLPQLEDLTGVDRQFALVPSTPPGPVEDRVASIGSCVEDSLSLVLAVTYVSTPELVPRLLTDGTRIADTLRGLVATGAALGILAADQFQGTIDEDAGLVVVSFPFAVRYRRR